jgi:ubiquinone/menaquinone biosynthesis C-methylase UbiE
MTTVKDKIAVPPMKISQILHGYWALQVLRTGVELDVFGQLAAAPADVATVAAAVKADRRAVEMLLDALTGVGLLLKTGDKYSLTEDARVYLVPSSELFMGRYIKQNDEIDAMWRSLGETVKSGKPAREVNQDAKAQEFFPALTEAIFPLNFATAQRVSQELKIAQLPAGAKVLDVAAGAATWSIPMALDNQQVHVDVLDFPAILEVTKKFAQKYGVGERFGYISGNWRNVPWQRDIYEVVVLGHILHSEGKELGKQLLRRVFEAMKPGGTLVIAEFIANNERSGPPFAMLFGVNMLMHTTIGCVFTESELATMVAEAGFEKARRMPLEGMPESPILIARKPG